MAHTPWPHMPTVPCVPHTTLEPRLYAATIAQQLSWEGPGSQGGSAQGGPLTPEPRWNHLASIGKRRRACPCKGPLRSTAGMGLADRVELTPEP